MKCPQNKKPWSSPLSLTGLTQITFMMTKSHAQFRVTSWGRLNAALYLAILKNTFRMRWPRLPSIHLRRRNSRCSWSMTLHTTFSCWRSSSSRSRRKSRFLRSKSLRPIQEGMPWRSLKPSSTPKSRSSTSYSWTLTCPLWMESSAQERLKNFSRRLRLVTIPSSLQSPDWHWTSTRRSTRVALRKHSMVFVSPFPSLTSL